MGERRLDSPGLRWERVVGCCEIGNEPSDSGTSQKDVVARSYAISGYETCYSTLTLYNAELNPICP